MSVEETWMQTETEGERREGKRSKRFDLQTTLSPITHIPHSSIVRYIFHGFDVFLYTHCHPIVFSS